MRLKILTSVLVLSSALLSACETMTSSSRVIVSSAEKWALLPITNLSATPLAGNRASTILETHLRSRGVKNLEVYAAPRNQSVIDLLNDSSQLKDAKAWARENGFRYGITGDVQEWQYKNGLDNEPSVGMTLKFVDLHSDEVMWTANATRTGWGYANLSSTASKAIEELLTQVNFKAQRRGAPTMAAAKGTAMNDSVLPPPPGSDNSDAELLGNGVTSPIRPNVIDQP